MAFALLPAGGRSSRMGQPKLLLSLGRRTVLEHTIMALRDGGADRVLVVAAPDLPGLVEVAGRAGAHALPLSAETADMRATVQFGLDWVAEHWRPLNDEAWLLSPADHPVTSPRVVRSLIMSWRDRQTPASIFVPSRDGVRRGHPVLMSWHHAVQLRGFPADQGINTYLRTHTDLTTMVLIDDADMYLDLDTPEDYARLVARFGGGRQSEGECV